MKAVLTSFPERVVWYQIRNRNFKTRDKIFQKFYGTSNGLQWAYYWPIGKKYLNRGTIMGLVILFGEVTDAL